MKNFLHRKFKYAIICADNFLRRVRFVIEGWKNLWRNGTDKINRNRFSHRNNFSVICADGYTCHRGIRQIICKRFKSRRANFGIRAGYECPVTKIRIKLDNAPNHNALRHRNFLRIISRGYGIIFIPDNFKPASS